MSLTMSAPPLAVVVKQATHQNHTAVEQLLLPKLAAIKTVADYAAVLNMFYGYFFPLEQRIHQHLLPAHLPDIHERRNAAFILTDLSNLRQPVQNIEQCSELPEINNTAQAFGAMYVLEGSTLGGTMIAKMLRQNELLSLPEDALHFFSGYKQETGSKWKSFLAALNEQAHAEQVVASANQTFLCLKRWMQHSIYHGEQ